MATVLMFAGNFAPLSWAYCNGALIGISQNTALFALLGTTYGGDGQVTFALPDLRSRVPIGTGQGPGRSYYTLGEVSGVENTTLLTMNLPAHNHSLSISTTDGPGSSDDPSGNILALQNANVFAAPGASNGNYGGVTVSRTGNNQPVTILPPYVAINYIICVEGIFPSRN